MCRPALFAIILWMDHALLWQTIEFMWLVISLKIVRIHCASKDDDLGYHNLFPGQDFHWSFCAEFLPITLFFCHLWWFPKEKAFEVYKESFTRVRTPQSWWVAKSDGIYFSNQTDPTGLTKRFNWEG